MTVTECGKYAVWGSRCIEEIGHSGEHRSSYGHSWTDESDRRAAAESVKTMGGRTE